MTPKAPKYKPGLKNPAVMAAASSPAGQKALADSKEIQSELIKEGVKGVSSTVGFVFKVLLLAGAGYFIYRLYTKQFRSLKPDNNLPPANVSDGQAAAKAQALYEAMYGFGANFDLAAEALQGLNHNGWVKVYNAFGLQQPANPLADEMNLVEWLLDQYSDDDLKKLRFILPGEF